VKEDALENGLHISFEKSLCKSGSFEKNVEDPDHLTVKDFLRFLAATKKY